MRASPLCRPMYLLPLLLGMLFHELTEQALQWMEKYGDGNAQIDISFHLIIKILFYFLQNCNLLNVNTNRLPKYIFLMCLFCNFRILYFFPSVWTVIYFGNQPKSTHTPNKSRRVNSELNPKTIYLNIYMYLKSTVFHIQFLFLFKDISAIQSF